MSEQKPRAALYTRISEKDEKVDKVENQLQALREAAQKHGYDVADEYADDDISAFRGKKERPEFRQLLLGLKGGRFDVIMATEPQRFTRGSATELEALNLLCVQGGTVWHTLAGGVQDPATPMTKAMMGIADIMGGLEVEDKIRRQQLRYDAEAAAGRGLWGVRPYGYEEDRITIREEEAREVAWAYKTFLTNSSVYEIQKSWNARGVLTSKDKPWTRQAVKALLSRPRNVGIVMRRGIAQTGVEAAWKPLIDQESYESAVAILNDRKRESPAGRKPVHLLATIARCGTCGGPLRSMTANGKPVLRCRNKTDNPHLTDKHGAIATHLIDPLVVSEVAKAFLLGTTDLLPADRTDTAPLEAELSKIRASRARLVKLVTSDLIDESDAAKELAALKAREADIVTEKENLTRESARASMLVDLRADVFHDGRASIQKAGNAHAALMERFESLPLAQRRELVKALLDIVVNPGRGTDRIEITHKKVTSLN